MATEERLQERAVRQQPRPALERPVRDEQAALEPFPLDRRSLVQFLAAYLGLALIGLVSGFALTSQAADGPMLDLDRRVALWWAEQRTPALDTLTDLGSALADTVPIVVALVVLTGVLLLAWRRWREVLTLDLALALETSVFLTVSLIVGRERPPIEQLDGSPPTASFPSGHVGAATAFYLTLVLIVWLHHRHPSIRIVAAGVGVAAVVAVALSRMYRGMHFLTDVVMGALLGLACVAVAVWIVTSALRRKRETS